MIDIRLPNITGKSEAEQLAQIKSYLYQFAGQLQWALSTVEAGNSSNVVLQKNGSGGLSEKDTAVSNFNQIKSLIIKSADIVEAFYEEFSKRLEGQYVAQSDFGTYLQNTSMDIEGNSTSIKQMFKNYQEISDTVDELYDSSIDTNAYIKHGYLYDADNGTQVYGVEVGQTDIINGKQVFNQFARFTADKLSFFDSNSIEVAYISDYKLFITNAYITGTLQLNGFVFDTSNGIALRPV